MIIIYDYIFIIIKLLSLLSLLKKIIINQCWILMIIII